MKWKKRIWCIFILGGLNYYVLTLKLMVWYNALILYIHVLTLHLYLKKNYNYNLKSIMHGLRKTRTQDMQNVDLNVWHFEHGRSTHAPNPIVSFFTQVIDVTPSASCSASLSSTTKQGTILSAVSRNETALYSGHWKWLLLTILTSLVKTQASFFRLYSPTAR